MSQNEDLDPILDFDLSVLVFTINGILFGVDSEQVADIVNFGETGDEIDISSFNKLIADTSPRKGGPEKKVLIMKDFEGRGLLVDRLDDIKPFGIGSIHPLPPLIASQLKSKLIWGIALIEAKMILLLDFSRSLL